MTAAILITGWQVLGAVAVVLLVLCVACVGLVLWASERIVHDIYNEE